MTQEPDNELTRMLTGMRSLNAGLKENPGLTHALGEEARRAFDGLPAPLTPEELDAAWAREQAGEGEVAGDGATVSPPEGPGAPALAARSTKRETTTMFGFKPKPGPTGTIEFGEIEYIDIQAGVVVVDGKAFKLAPDEVKQLGAFAIQVMARELTRSIVDLAKRAGVELPSKPAQPPNETEAASGDGADPVVPAVPKAP